MTLDDLIVQLNQVWAEATANGGYTTHHSVVRATGRGKVVDVSYGHGVLMLWAEEARPRRRAMRTCDRCGEEKPEGFWWCQSCDEEHLTECCSRAEAKARAEGVAEGRREAIADRIVAALAQARAEALRNVRDEACGKIPEAGLNREPIPDSRVFWDWLDREIGKAEEAGGS